VVAHTTACFGPRPVAKAFGWSLGEIARVDPGYLVWLAERPEGEPYRREIDGLLVKIGFHRNTEHDTSSHPWRSRSARF